MRANERNLLFGIVAVLLALNCYWVEATNGTIDNLNNLNEIKFNVTDRNENQTVSSEELAIPADPVEQSKVVENVLKTGIKSIFKQILPHLMTFDLNLGSGLSSPCLRSLAKYLGALMTTRVWAIRMLDATSKVPAGILEGTFSDFGAFDECLEISVPKRSGIEEFRGAYCAIEAQPYVRQIPKNFSLARRFYARPLEPISNEFSQAGSAFYYFNLRYGVCVPSTCKKEDMQSIATTVGKHLKMQIKIPVCYTKENVKFEILHFIVISVLILLILACITGTVLDFKDRKSGRKKMCNQSHNSLRDVFLAFSVSHNYKKLFATPNDPNELKALHGIRALSIAWVILGHIYVWPNFMLLRRPQNIQNYFNHFTMGAILNAWLSVDSFFFLSGLLTCTGCMRYMQKSKGRLPVLPFIIRRYMRLTPSFLLVMGLIFFLPLISSGPFWYEKFDPEVKACKTHWWANLLYINNWFSLDQICIHPTWYLAADFQLSIFALLIVFPLYRSAKCGFLAITLAILASFSVIGVITYLWDLSPIILISSGNQKLINDTINFIHIRTFTHIGPYCIGMLTGYFILMYRDIKIDKVICCCFWLLSFITSTTSVYGIYPWSSGQYTGPLLTSLYAALHRTMFTIGVAWVAYACVSRRAGLMNSFLSLPIFVPLSRLTYTTYLTQSLIIWTRRASERERFYFSHYNQIYEWIPNWIISVLFAIPLYLLVEAPMANLDRLIFSKFGKKDADQQDTEMQKDKAILQHSIFFRKSRKDVELKSVQTIQPDILGGNLQKNYYGSPYKLENVVKT